jgi:DNA-binding GntR family transcriptional regulator
MTDAPGPSAPPSRGQAAAEHLRRLIFSGALRPGDRVPQEQVAAALGMSRIPVREGIVALEAEGWLRLEPNRGAFVNHLDQDSVRDHYELYGLTYGFAVQRATERGGPTLGRDLAELARQMRSTADPHHFTELTVRFHATVVSAARSPGVKVVLRNLSTIVPGEFFAEVPAALALERSAAGAIARAVRAGDGEAAAEAYRRSLRRMGDEVVRLLAAKGLFDP